MAKVTLVKKAQKDHPECGVKAGDRYYTWSMASGGRHRKMCSKTAPRKSQTTNSPFWQGVYGLQETVEYGNTPDNAYEAQILQEDYAEGIDSLRDQEQEKYDNMPDALRDAVAGELVQERIDALESWADEVRSHEWPDRYDLEDGSVLDEDAYVDAMTESTQELASIAPECS